MRARSFFSLILRSAAPSEASRHFSQDRELRAKFFVGAQASCLGASGLRPAESDTLNNHRQERRPPAPKARCLCSTIAPRALSAAVSALVRRRLTLLQ